MNGDGKEGKDGKERELEKVDMFWKAEEKEKCEGSLTVWKLDRMHGKAR